MNKIEQFVKLFCQRVKNETILHRSGYWTDQKGIQKRYLREKANWDKHLQNSKNYIISSCSKLQQREQIAILGSGWLLDVPFQQLSPMFGKVDFYDIIHPGYVKEKIKKYKNIRLIETDLTGGLIKYADDCMTLGEFISGMNEIKPALALETYDMVVSLNLLNQLDILLCDFLIKKFGAKAEELFTVRQKIQKCHLAMLPLMKTCLITDYKELSVNEKNEIINEKDLLFVPFPAHYDSMDWPWVFDTHYTYSNKFNTTFKVKAIRF